MTWIIIGIALILFIGFCILLINKLMAEHIARMYHGHYWKNNTKKRKKKGDRSCGK